MRRMVGPVIVSVGLLLGGAVDPLSPRADPAPAAPVSSGPSAVTLVTGDRAFVTQTPDGRPSVTVVPGGAATAHGFQVLTTGSHVYVIPQVAAAYVGAPLDLSLFDVGPGTANYGPRQAPLTANYSATPRIPGLASAGPGRLTVRDPAAFGRALTRDWSAGKRGHLFDGVTRLARANAGRPSSLAGKLYTLTVKAYDRRGQRVNADLGTVMNADNVDTFLAAQSFYNGRLAYSVPAGHYSIASYIATGYADHSVDYTLASAPDVWVGRDTTVVLDARQGRRFSADVGHPAPQLTAELNVQRNPTTGVSFTDSFTSFGATALYATPTPTVHTGQLYFYPGLRLGDPQKELYDLEFPYIGAIPRTLTQTITSSQLATITARYHSAVPGRAEFEAREAAMPWQASQVFAANTLVAPVTRTEHVLATPGLRWLQQAILDNADGLGLASDTVHEYQAGQQLGVDWAAQPMAPGVEQETQAAQACPACRVGDALDLTLFGGVDSSGHLMLADPSTTEALTLYQDGKQVGQAASGFASLPLSPAPASYRLVYDTTRTGTWWPTSTRTHTAWTFTSTHRAGDPLPPGWICGGKGSGGGRGDAAAAPGPGSGDGGCSFEPLLFTRFATGAGADDVVPAGQAAHVEVDVAHQLGAAATPITSFGAQVSYDDGTTWTDVPATRLADGRYRLDYSQPVLAGTNGFAALHVTAADANGSAIDQTITRAYPLAVTTPAPPSGNPSAPPQPACTAATAPYMQCFAVVDAAAGVDDAPNGYGPADVQAAYRVPARGHGRTVAIVDAYDDPNAEADLAAYREQYGLPPCTTANGCFRKVNQHGQSSPLPNPDPGWGLEISLDLDAVSATCPACHILLVEADSSSGDDLLTGVLTADRMHVDAISNSYGTTGEFSGEQTLEHYYQHLRTPTLVATGDYGYGNGRLLVGSISYPSASRYVIAVGGTSLVRDNSRRGWTESAWDGATSGCSAYIRKPAWQHDQLCAKRTVADVSAVADPNTGLAVRDTFGYAGWLRVGGTSLATPIVSSLYAMGAGDVRELYRDRSAVYDVVGGSNGTNCSNTYLCNGVPGYDGPTGLGTPNASDRYWTGY